MVDGPVQHVGARQGEPSGGAGLARGGVDGQARASLDEIAFTPLCAVFRRTLKEANLKYTPERAQVLDTVVRLEGAFEAEKVLADVRAAGFRVSKATVYRTLRLLMDAGIIQRVLVTEDQSYYQLTYGRSASELIIRTDTGALIPVEVPELAEIVRRLCERHGLACAGHRLQVFAGGRGTERRSDEVTK
jgi:Fur family ferric uptake transcriptional regulator